MVFVLSKVEDVIELAPDTSNTDTAIALTSAINAKYANRVIMDVGLAICLFDLLSQSDGIVKPGNGSAYMTVVFRVIVFRPFLGEVLTGKIASQDASGLKITLGFFDDIQISSHHLPEGSTFDLSENIWIWETDGNKLYLDNDEQIRFKVEHEQFIDCTPTQRNPLQASNVPYALQASAATPGLGLMSWWED
ncbi:RNA polymerase III subunit Rpc25 [Protomyces lactucae-debilis]|uniref:DNA-directed RNA polymerase subunit n=1 Tax=Protomyces lactucae-debilis TaxID=2754530 RepID=A0A1Y2FKF3_PROLT|nr:RNA polymerase III subunit Rpc25 [Protomyces lactucae-debilis]ORY83696.1 RNA polymerase III subunit Rpc25 [Protomyces lactucae-debilis]